MPFCCPTNSIKALTSEENVNDNKGLQQQQLPAASNVDVMIPQ